MRYYFFIFLVFSYTSLSAQRSNFTASYFKIISNAQYITPKQKLATLLTYQKTLEDASCVYDSVYAGVLRQIGFIYSDQSDFIKAIQYFQKSVRVITSNFKKPGINPGHLIKSYYWLSTFYGSLNNGREKIKAIDSCISVSQQLNDLTNISCIRALAIRTEYFFDVGDYQRSVDDAKMCEQLAWKFASKDPTQAQLGQEIALTSVGWLIEASEKLKEFDKAETFLSGKINAYEKSGPGNYPGFLYSQSAQLEIQKKNYSKALLLFNKSLAIEKKGGYNFTCKQILNAIAHDIYFVHYNDNAKALLYYTNALRYRNSESQKSKDDTIETINILTRIGNVYVRQGLYDKALKKFQQAFDLILPGMTEEKLLRLPADQLLNFKKTHILTGLVIDKGDAYLEKYKQSKNKEDVREAVSIFEAADRLLVMLRANQTDLKSKLFWRSSSRRLYERAIEACYLLNDTDKAFYFFEKSRATLLNEQLMQQSFLRNDDIINQVQLKKRMLLLEKERSRFDINSNQYDSLQNQLFLCQQATDRLTEQIKKKNPLYYQSVLDTSFISLPDVYQRILKEQQAIVEIFSGDSSVYALCITHGKTLLKKIEKIPFENAANSYINFIINPSLLNENFAGFVNVAHQLYQLIFQGLPLPKGRIIISPDGQNFPFESLVEKTDPSLPIYFLNDHAVSYTYSTRYLLNNFTYNQTDKEGDFLGIAPVNFNQGMASLPGSDLSLVHLANYFGANQNLLKTEASKNGFINHFTNYSIIQVYTHAAANSHEKEPVIYFADSALYLSDLIPENKPVTKLIVLSACETGLGQLYLGEGVFNFNRGFAACGIPSSITNLWSVDNRATYKLTELFYKYVSRGLPIDMALQQAKKEFIETGSRSEQLPYYWAAAILTGKAEAIICAQQISSTPYFLIIGLLCLCAFVVVVYEIKRSNQQG